jgi:hypothetical protein
LFVSSKTWYISTINLLEDIIRYENTNYNCLTRDRQSHIDVIMFTPVVVGVKDVRHIFRQKNLKIPKVYSESELWRRRGNIMTKRKRTNNQQPHLHRKLQLEQHYPHYNRGEHNYINVAYIFIRQGCKTVSIHWTPINFLVIFHVHWMPYFRGIAIHKVKIMTRVFKQ